MWFLRFLRMWIMLVAGFAAAACLVYVGYLVSDWIYDELGMLAVCVLVIVAYLGVCAACWTPKRKDD